KEIAAVAPAYACVTWDLLEWEAWHVVVVPYDAARQPLEYIPVATALPSASADMVLHSARPMYDDGVLMRHGLSLHRLAPGAAAHLNPDDARRLGVTVGDGLSIEAGDVTTRLPVVIDPSLHHGVVYVPFNQPDGPALGSNPAVTVSAV